MTSSARRRVVAALLVIAVSAGALYLSRPKVPAGQSPLATLDAASVETLREAFNRDADHVRIFILQSPT